eukprot:SAG22_NODE_1312_length_4776_cov_2.886466_2_plen_169_part_00
MLTADHGHSPVCFLPSFLPARQDVISTKQLEAVFRKIEANTKTMVDAIAADERASASLEVMEIIFSASMGFDLMIRMFGIDQGTNAGVGHVICGPDKEEPGYSDSGILAWEGEVKTKALSFCCVPLSFCLRPCLSLRSILLGRGAARRTAGSTGRSRTLSSCRAAGSA